MLVSLRFKYEFRRFSSTIRIGSQKAIMMMVMINMAIIFTCGTRLYAQSEELRQVTPEAVSAFAEKLATQDALLVAQAIAWSLEGIADASLLAPVIFAIPTEAPVPEPQIREGGFRLMWITINRNSSPRGMPENERAIEGLLWHADVFGRAIHTAFYAYYLLSQTGEIVILDTDTGLIDVLAPRVSVYFCPAQKISQDFIKTYRGAKLLEYVRSKAVTFGDFPVIDRTEKDYWVSAFFMDRVAEDAQIRIAVGDRPGDTRGDSSGMFTLQENGWHSAYTKARFTLDGDLEVFFKVFYTPGGDVPLAERQTIMDVFTSRVSRISIDQIRNIQEALDARGYDPGPVDGQMGRRTRQAIRQFQTDEKLRVDGKPTHALLHILTAEGHPSAVEMVQLKLTKLGYNPGPVNGQMGRRTRQAIQQFQQDQGLATDGILSCDLLGNLAYLCDPSSTAEAQAKHPPAAFMSEQIALRNQLKAKIWPNHVRRP